MFLCSKAMIKCFEHNVNMVFAKAFDGVRKIKRFAVQELLNSRLNNRFDAFGLKKNQKEHARDQSI